MEELNIVLPVLLYTFGIILLIVLIILGIRLIQILDRVEKIVDNVEGKVNSLNGFFSAIDKTTYGISMISDKVVSGLVNLISKIFNRNKNKDEEEDYYG